MSIENGGRHVKWDTTTGASRPGVVHVNSVRFTSGLTGGTTTLQSDGVTWFSMSIPASLSTAIELSFCTPQKAQNLTLSALGTNVIVWVFFA